MTKKRKAHREPSGIFSWLTTAITGIVQKIFHRAALNHKSDKEEKKNSERVTGDIYELGCNATAGEIISGGLDRGSKYPSSSTDS